MECFLCYYYYQHSWDLYSTDEIKFLFILLCDSLKDWLNLLTCVFKVLFSVRSDTNSFSISDDWTIRFTLSPITFSSIVYYYKFLLPHHHIISHVLTPIHIRRSNCISLLIWLRVLICVIHIWISYTCFSEQRVNLFW